jgi:hypothetical protein
MASSWKSFNLPKAKRLLERLRIDVSAQEKVVSSGSMRRHRR